MSLWSSFMPPRPPHPARLQAPVSVPVPEPPEPAPSAPRDRVVVITCPSGTRPFLAFTDLLTEEEAEREAEVWRRLPPVPASGGLARYGADVRADR